MAWADFWKNILKGIIQVNVTINLPEKFDVNTTNIKNYHLIYKPDSPRIELDPQNDKTLLINLAEQEKLIEEAIRAAVTSEGIPLIEQSAEQLIEDFKSSGTFLEVRKVVDSLTAFIPPSDLLILRASLYLRSVFKSGLGGGEVQRLKQDIILRFGDRGRNITNLCTAGYFETTIIPLLEAMKESPDFLPDHFTRIYNLLIDQHAFAVFVSGWMDQEKVTKAIMNQINANCKYGVKYVYIHGIGTENIKKIRKAVELILVTSEAIEKTNEDMLGKVISVRLIFNADLAPLKLAE